MKRARSPALIVVCAVFLGLRAHAERAPEVNESAQSVAQTLTESVKSQLSGEWRGAGVTLRLERSGSAILSHRRLTPQTSQVQRPHLKGEEVSQAQSDQRRVGLWWLTERHGATQLCLYLQLTARCYPIQVTPHEPQRIWIRLGRAHLELTRHAQTGITASEE